MSSASEKVVTTAKTRAKRSVGRPKQVSMEQIFAAAATIGLGNLTLQAVAEALGVTPPALYRHVQGREDLIAKFVKHVVERYPAPEYHGEGWAHWATLYARALMDVYGAVPGLADYSIRRTDTGHNILNRHEISIKAAKDSGFNEVSAFYATRAIIEFVAGWVARHERRNVFERELKVHPDVEFKTHVLEETGDDYPNLKAAVKAVTQLSASHRFEFTLRALIAGLESTMAAEAASKTKN
ncbi:MAG: TetR/AcrR family transcriptional regulator [Polaromonas sp.]|uniref:TetR/AcrR family transcriptional regulator n=1 Tax=Polaromonas sp. TaxID=1869339 RepID=UPI0025EE7AA1|nr:TetR/AcrR family transcriptional regulator [Polaromonas sp.]MBI2726075.1 TetR/AcrR family transcriptional regulator [Polaromonas sp.]